MVHVMVNRNLALEELIQIGREADRPVQISHFKLAAADIWGQASQVIQRLEQATARGTSNEETYLKLIRDAYEGMDEEDMVALEEPPEMVMAHFHEPSVSTFVNKRFFPLKK